MLNLNTAILGRLPVALPNGSERLEIVNALDALDNQVRTLEQNGDGLGRVKHALISVLLTGELRVTPDTDAA